MRSKYYEIVLSRIEGQEDSLKELRLIECLKFLVITSATRGRRIAVDPLVDEYWHELILQTQPYHRMCRTMPGGRYIHHESITPQRYEQRVGEREFVREFLQWIPDYVQNFGSFRRETLTEWTVGQFAIDTLKLSLDEINEIGMREPAEVLIPDDSVWTKLRHVSNLTELIELVPWDESETN